MAHELVFKTDSQGNETKIARLLLRQAKAWHDLGQVLDTISLQDIHDCLETDIPVELCNLTYPDGMVVSDARGLRWKNGKNGPYLHLGVVGPETCPLQNKDFVNSVSTWLDSDLGEIESAGLLKGGAIIFIQIRAKNLESVTIRTLKNGEPDIIQPFIGLVNGHGGMGIAGGRTDIRIVCNNTLTAAYSNMNSNKSLIKFSHRASELKAGKFAEASNKVVMRIDDINKFQQDQYHSFMAAVEQYKFLNSVTVKPTGGKIEHTLAQYAENVFKGKSAPDVLNKDYETSKHASQTQLLFDCGKGNDGETWFDAWNAMTEFLSWGKGNALKGDRLGDSEARRMEDLMFGDRNKKLVAALNVATEMARSQI